MRVRSDDCRGKRVTKGNGVLRRMSLKVGLIACAVLIAGAAAGCEPAADSPEYKNHGAQVSDVAHNTDQTGRDKGAAVSEVARNGHDNGAKGHGHP
jgi:hypothetical protein